MAQYWYDKHELLTNYEESKKGVIGAFAINTQVLKPIDLRYEYIEVEVEARHWYGRDYRTDIAIVENRRFDNYIDYKIELAGERHPFEEIIMQNSYYRQATHYYNGQKHTGIFKYGPRYKDIGTIRLQVEEKMENGAAVKT